MLPDILISQKLFTYASLSILLSRISSDNSMASTTEKSREQIWCGQKFDHDKKWCKYIKGQI